MSGINSNTKLMLKADTISSKSITTDCGKTAHSITPVGTAMPVKNDFKFGTHSAYLTTNGVLTIPDSVDWDVCGNNTDSRTVDFWVKLNSHSGSDTLIGQAESIGIDRWEIQHAHGSGATSLVFVLSTGGVNTIIVNGPSEITDNNWHHIALVKEANKYTLYLDGVGGTPVTDNDTDTFVSTLHIGARGKEGIFDQFLNGYIDEIRISNGIARWTANFTPPTQAYDTDVYTKLLLHFDGNLNDSSGRGVGKAVTAVGTARSIRDAKKFGTNSGFFNADSFLSIPDHADWNFGSSNFTMDFWINFNALGITQSVIDQYDSASLYWQLYLTSNNTWRLSVVSGGATIIDVSQATANTVIDVWYHIALVRNGNVFNIYQNGLLIATVTDTDAMLDCTTALGIGAIRVAATPGNFTSAYLDEIRISKGVARWTSEFTPPTSAYTSDSDTKLLLHLDGNVTDSGNTGHTVTKNNMFFSDAKVGNGCIVLDGNSDYLSIPDSDDWFFGTGDFTIDFWANIGRLTASYSVIPLYRQYVTSVANTNIWWEPTAGKLEFYSAVTGVGVMARYHVVWTPTVNTWYHLAFVRNGSNFYMFIDGVSQTLVVTTAISTNSLPNIASALDIGRYWDGGGSDFLNGYIDELRVSKGIARWTSGFTPSTTPYSTDSYTKLLLHSEIDFADNSLTGYKATPTGTAVIPCVFGESSLFVDGNSDCLTIPDSDDWCFSSGNFTIDFRVNYLSLVSGGYLFGQWVSANSGWLISCSGGTLYVQISADGSTPAVAFTYSWTPVNGTWYHLAVVRYGNSLKVYIDGTQVGSTVDVTGVTFYNSSTLLCIGAQNASSGYSNVLFDEIRISKGIARWTGNFTPPIASYKAADIDTYTKLLLHCDEVEPSETGTKGIIDAGKKTGLTAGKIITQVGTAQLLRNNHKFGTSAAYFNGTGGYLSVPTSEDFNFGTENFTIDLWAYITLAGTGQFGTFGKSYYTVGQNGNFSFQVSESQVHFFSYDGQGNAEGTSVGSLSSVLNTWAHFAIVRNGNVVKVYRNGTEVLSVAVTKALGGNTGALLIGWDNLIGQKFPGYIDEFRVSKGIARWTTAFTPSTTAYATDSNTKLLLHFDGDLIDSSGVGYPITPYSSPVVMRAAIGSGCVFLNGTTQRLTLADSADWDFGSGDFTEEAWVYFNVLPSSGASSCIMGQFSGTDQAQRLVVSNNAGTYYISFTYTANGSTQTLVDSSAIAITAGSWHHIAFARSGNTGYFFYDGLAVGTANLTGITIWNSSRVFSVGVADSEGTPSEFLSGFLDEIRISNGIARYTATFAPSTTAFTSDSYTKLLLHLESDFTDSSGTPKTVTLVNSPSICPKIGTGALKLNAHSNLNQCLQVPDSNDWYFANDDITLEAWGLISTLPADGMTQYLVEQWAYYGGTNYYNFAFGFRRIAADTAGQYRLNFRWSVDGTTDTSNMGVAYTLNADCPNTATLLTGVWYHFAFVRKGNVGTFYLNGTSIGTISLTGRVLANTAQIFCVGAYWTESPLINPWQGLLDEIRVSKGIARYNANFTAPTTAFVADKYTKLLLHFTATDFIDSSGTDKKVIEVNSPATSIVSPKVGKSSLLLNGTTQYLRSSNHSDFNFGSGDFTIESWVNLTALPALDNAAVIASQWTATGGQRSWCFQIGRSAGGVLTLNFVYSTNGTGVAGTLSSSALTINTGTWYHFAMTVSDSADLVYFFQDGVAKGSSAYTATLFNSTSSIGVGAQQIDSTPANFITGYMDEVRISKGIARWTSGFTPTTIPYETDSYTKLLLHFDSGYEDDSKAGNQLTSIAGANSPCKFGNAGLWLDGNSDGLTIPTSGDFTYGSGDFTLEGWLNSSTVTVTQCVTSKRANSATAVGPFLVYISASKLNFLISFNGTSWGLNITHPLILVNGQWYHWAFVKSGTTYYAFINGTMYSLGTVAGTLVANSELVRIGIESDGNYFNGYMDEVRFSGGLAKYVSNFDVPTVPYLADNYTKLLTHFNSQDNSYEGGNY